MASERRRANPEGQRRYAKQYAETHRRERALAEAKRRARARGEAGSVSVEEIDAIRSAQRDRCGYCRARLRGKGEIDHIKPLSRGGKHVARNVQLLCNDCNRRKYAKDAADFARSLGMLI